MSGGIYQGFEGVERILESARSGNSMLVLSRMHLSVREYVDGITRGLGLEVTSIGEEEFMREADMFSLVLALLTGATVTRPVSLIIVSLLDGTALGLVTQEFLMVYIMSDNETYIIYHDNEEGYCVRVGRGIGLALASDAPPTG